MASFEFQQLSLEVQYYIVTEILHPDDVGRLGLSNNFTVIYLSWLKEYYKDLDKLTEAACRLKSKVLLKLIVERRKEQDKLVELIRYFSKHVSSLEFINYFVSIVPEILIEGRKVSNIIHGQCMRQAIKRCDLDLITQINQLGDFLTRWTLGCTDNINLLNFLLVLRSKKISFKDETEEQCQEFLEDSFTEAIRKGHFKTADYWLQTGVIEKFDLTLETLLFEKTKSYTQKAIDLILSLLSVDMIYLSLLQSLLYSADPVLDDGKVNKESFKYVLSKYPEMISRLESEENPIYRKILNPILNS